MLYSKIRNGFYSVDIHTEIPLDAIEISQELYLELMEKQSNGYIISSTEGSLPFAEMPTNTVDSIKTSIVTLTQARLDQFANSRNYDSILSACTYATSAVPKFQKEGQSAVNARDNTWSALYSILDEVQSGVRQMPTSFADVESYLPTLSWLT